MFYSSVSVLYLWWLYSARLWWLHRKFTFSAFQANSSDDKLKTETVRQMLYSFVLVRHAWWLYREFPVETKGNVFCVFTYVASIYSNLLEQKKAFTYEKSSTPTGLVWDTNMAAVSLFWDTNMATMMSCENTLLSGDRHQKVPRFSSLSFTYLDLY